MGSDLTIDIQRTDGTGVTDFTYRADDRLNTVDGPFAGDKLIYRYNALGNLIDITPEQGQVVSYKYDYDTNVADIDLGRLKSITTGTNTYTYDYDGVNPLIQRLTRPNGSYTEYQYNDPLKRLTALINKASTGNLINSFAYTYDKDLIKTETVTNGAIIDNFLEKTTSYQSNAVNQLLSATTSPDPAKVYGYDNDGNMTTGYTPEGYALFMTYDAQNRMKTAQYDDGTSHLFQYSYAGNSLLSEVIKDGVTTKYLRSGFLPIQERDASNAITREYTWGKNLGGGIGGLLNLKQNNQDYSYLYDGKGNVSALIDSSQTVVASYAYDPFGLLMKDTSTIDQPYRFSTKEAYAGTGLVGFGYRTYDSCSGKWTTRDPLGETPDLNVYRMVGNNAVNFADPLGLLIIFVHGTWSNGVDAFPRNYRKHVQDYFRDQNSLAFEWSGDNCDKARRAAGAALADLILRYRQLHPFEVIRIVAHSHGGNVALLASQNQGVDIDTLVSLGTPILSAYQLGNGISSWINVHSLSDRVQTLPSGARRTSSQATNIQLRNYGHSELHTINAWDAAFPQTR